MVRSQKRFRGSKRRDAGAFDALCASYTAFVCDVIAPRVAQQWRAAGSSAGGAGQLDRVFFQRQPCLRVSPPKASAMGRRHRDRDYGHQPGMVNFWLPLAPAAGCNTLFVEPFDVRAAVGGAPPLAEPGRGREGAPEPAAAAGTAHTALEGTFGDCWQFYGNGAMHYTVPNVSGHTRVSLDFRVVPGPLYVG